MEAFGLTTNMSASGQVRTSAAAKRRRNCSASRARPFFRSIPTARRVKLATIGRLLIRAAGCPKQPLFLFAGGEARLPGRGFLAGRRGNDLDLLLFGLLGFPVAPPLAFGHVGLLRFFEMIEFIRQ